MRYGYGPPNLPPFLRYSESLKNAPPSWMSPGRNRLQRWYLVISLRSQRRAQGANNEEDDYSRNGSFFQSGFHSAEQNPVTGYRDTPTGEEFEN